MKSDEEVDVKFDEDEAEDLEKPVIESLDLEKDFEVNESLEAEKQIPGAGEEAGEIDVSPADFPEETLDLETEELEAAPETIEEKIGDKEADLEYDELEDMIEKEGEEVLKEGKEEPVDLDTETSLDEGSEEIDVSPADKDALVETSEDKEDFSEFLKEDFIENIDFEDSSPKKSGSPEDVDMKPYKKADEGTIEDIDTLMPEEGEIKEDIGLEDINGLEPIDFDEEDIGGEIATMTLSEIYISQDKYDKALQVLEILKAKEPDNPKIDEKIKEIKKNMNA